MIIKVLRPISVVGVLFLSCAGLYINFYVIEVLINMGWTVWFPCVTLPFIGLFGALGIAFLFRQTKSRAITISIETGVQNMPLAILLIRASLQSPARQLGVVGPVAAGLVTPFSIMSAILIRMIYLRYKGYRLSEVKEIQDEIRRKSLTGSIGSEFSIEEPPEPKRRMSMLDPQAIKQIYQRRVSLPEFFLTQNRLERIKQVCTHCLTLRALACLANV